MVEPSCHIRADGNLDTQNIVNLRMLTVPTLTTSIVEGRIYVVDVVSRREE